MTESTEKTSTLGFSLAHGERLALLNEEKEGLTFSYLKDILTEIRYNIDTSSEPLTEAWLDNIDVLILGAPQSDLDLKESAAVDRFLKSGGSLLLTVDAKAMVNLFFGTETTLGNMLWELSGIGLQEYHNYPPTYLQVFTPHYITAGVTKVRIGRIAALKLDEKAQPLARTKASEQVVLACSTVNQGRMVVVGDLEWLSDQRINELDNKNLAANTIRWLTGKNAVDIEQITIPQSIVWGESAVVSLYLQNPHNDMRPHVECLLESDADALIHDPVRKRRFIPPQTTTQMRWTVEPQILGDQKLRLSIDTEDEMLHFDVLPATTCLAPGYLTLETRNREGILETEFRTGDYLEVEGAFHWSQGKPDTYHLELDIGEGLLERGYEHGHGIDRWYLQAVIPGKHELVLKVVETGQCLLALINVRSSDKDRLDEIRAAYVYPLDAEIAERLKQVDMRLSAAEIRRQPFEILPPEKFIKEAYAERDVPWLLGILAAARREQYQNFSLLDLLLTHIAPTYLPARGTFIPYDPALASQLTRLHPTDRRYLEYNFLQDEESDPLTIKQNVAAYLLHEKYGHGFFFTHTKLGRQVTILIRHRVYDRAERYGKKRARITRLIRDSAIIINEGYAAWLELTFLKQLDRETRQASYPRYVLLIEKATGLHARKSRSDFFEAFPPKYDSPYREGYEYLDFIAKRFYLPCAIRAFLIATNIDFGITEDENREIVFMKDAEVMEDLLFATTPEWRSQARLEAIAKLLYDNLEVILLQIQEQHCPVDCNQDKCPINEFVEKELNWGLS